MPGRFIYFDNENYNHLTNEDNMSQLINNLLSEYYKNLKPQLDNLDLINSQSEIIKAELEELEKKKEKLKEREEQAKISQEEKDKQIEKEREENKKYTQKKAELRKKYETETPKDKQGMADFERYLELNLNGSD